MSYDDAEAQMNDLWIFDSQGRAVAYREEGFHVRQINGKPFGIHGHKRNTNLRTNEIFRGGLYVGEIRGDRLFFKEAKAGLIYRNRPLPTRMSRLRESRPRLKVSGYPVRLPRCGLRLVLTASSAAMPPSPLDRRPKSQLAAGAPRMPGQRPSYRFKLGKTRRRACISPEVSREEHLVGVGFQAGDACKNACR